MHKGLAVIQDAHKYTTRVEHDLRSEIQHLVAEARRVEGRCCSRIHMFEQTLATKRQEASEHDAQSLQK